MDLADNSMKIFFKSLFVLSIFFTGALRANDFSYGEDEIGIKENNCFESSEELLKKTEEIYLQGKNESSSEVYFYYNLYQGVIKSPYFKNSMKNEIQEEYNDGLRSFFSSLQYHLKEQGSENIKLKNYLEQLSSCYDKIVPKIVDYAVLFSYAATSFGSEEERNAIEECLIEYLIKDNILDDLEDDYDLWEKCSTKLEEKKYLSILEICKNSKDENLNAIYKELQETKNCKELIFKMACLDSLQEIVDDPQTDSSLAWSLKNSMENLIWDLE